MQKHLIFFHTQICLTKELSDDDRIQIEKSIRDGIYGVSQQFMDDFMEICEKYRHDPLIFQPLLVKYFVSKVSIIFTNKFASTDLTIDAF